MIGAIGALSLVASGIVAARPASAALSSVGPVDSTGLPNWYDDGAGLRLQLCVDASPPCFTTRPDLTTEPSATNLPADGEAFYFDAEADIARPGAPLTFMRLALEATYTGGSPGSPAATQAAFGRTRFRVFGLVPGASYTFTYPYGVKTFAADASGRINATDDIGCFPAGTPCSQMPPGTGFDAALTGIGSFLQWDPAIAPAPPAGYIGSFGTLHRIIGSPVGQNFWRIDGPNIGGIGVNRVETNLFDVQGKLAATVPGVTGPLSASAGPGAGQISLSWSAPADNGGTAITGYRIFRGTASGALSAIAPDLPSTATTFTDSGLPENSTRFYTVAAINRVGVGPQSTQVSSTTFARPSAPRTTTAVAGPGAGQVTVSWTAPTSTGGAALSAYRVYRGTASGALTAITDVAAGTTTFTDSGLPDGAARFYAITALNAVGESIRSNEATATTFSRPTAPATASATAGPGPGQISVSWSAPTSNGGSPVSAYRIYRGTASGALSLLTEVAAGTLSFVDANLPEGTARFYAITAVNVAGEGARSAEAAATTFARPSAPNNLTATPGPGAGQIAIGWAAPSSTGGTPVLGYRVYRSTGGGAPTLVADLGLVTTFTDSALVEGTTYSYTVAARNSVGEGVPTAAIAATTFARPSAPRAVTATSGPGAGQITVGWTVPLTDGGSGVTAYRIYRSVGGGAPTAIADVIGSARSYTDSGLPEGAARTYTVAARNVVGEGAASAASSATTFTRPAAPTSLTATPGSGQITLQWGAPASDGGSALTLYRVYAGPSAADLTAIADVAPSTRAFVESGLAEGTQRVYAVSALNQVGESALSAIANATTFARPAAPQNAAATAGPGNGAVTINWDPPVTDGGTAITGFRILRGTSPDTLVSAGTVGNTVRSFTDSGLGDGATRAYAIAAINAVGDGSPSATVVATTFARPAPPTALAAAAGPGAGEVSLTWHSPTSDGGRPLTGYRVYRSSGSGDLTFLREVPATVTSLTDSGLAEGVTYSYALAAINAVGEGTRTATVSATTFARPASPRSVTATGTALGRTSVTWQAPLADGGRPLTGFRIYRSSGGSSFVLVGTTGPASTSFNDAGLSPAAVYHYQVTAVNIVGESVPSSESCTLALPAPGTFPCSIL